MGCVISCGLKLVLEALNVVLCVAFLAVAVFGIILKSSKTVIQGLLEKVLSKSDVGNENMHQLVSFVTDNADGIAVPLIVLGFSLAALCLIGCIASCCGCKILLIIYAVILAVLLVIETIVVIVMFSDPARLSSICINAMDKALENYGKDTALGPSSTAVWSVLMATNGYCCGMTNYTDFGDGPYPIYCCNKTASDTSKQIGAAVSSKATSSSTTPPSTLTCPADEAKTADVPGCKSKIKKFVKDNFTALLYVSVAAILFQAALLLIVVLVICL